MVPTVISARATIPSAGLACPKTVTFKFRISVPAAGTCYYRYVRSDRGRSGKILQKTFAAAGEYDLPYNQDKPDYYWTLGKTYCGWTSIHFESVPTGDAVVSPSGALAHFTVNCPGDPNNAKFPAPADIGAWLAQHPTIANALKWQSVANANAYDTPTDAQKASYPAWTQAQKDDLAAAFQNAYSWFSYGSASKMSDDAPLTDKPENLVAPPINPVTSTVARMKVKLSYGWKLYYESVAHALAAELHGIFPNWSILSYNADSLAALFDSALMGTNANGFLIGTYASYVPNKRLGNQAHTGYGPPRWIYSQFMKKNNLIGNTRLATIGNVLEWARQNLAHFYGTDSYQNFFDIWQYYGFPPLSSVIAGTTDPNNGFAHWTAGCHGSLGFYTAVYIREWNTTNHEDPLQHITLNEDRTALVLEKGVYRLTGLSSLTMMASVYPVIDTVNAYPGCCYVYDAARWPVLPGPNDAGFGEFMANLFAVGSIAVAMYSGLSLFECIIRVRGAPARVSVAHQCGYVSAKAVNKVYVRVGGGDSLYHQTAKISIYQIG